MRLASVQAGRTPAGGAGPVTSFWTRPAPQSPLAVPMRLCDTPPGVRRAAQRTPGWDIGARPCSRPVSSPAERGDGLCVEKEVPCYEPGRHSRVCIHPPTRGAQDLGHTPRCPRPPNPPKPHAVSRDSSRPRKRACPLRPAPEPQPPHLLQHALQQGAGKGAQGQREATARHLLWALELCETLPHQATCREAGTG